MTDTQAREDDIPDAYPPRTRGLNFYDIDYNLQHFLMRVDPAFLQRQETTLKDLGDFAGGDLDEKAEENDRHFPAVLEQKVVDPVYPGERRGKVILNQGYKDCQQALYRKNTMAPCFDETSPESHLLPFITQYLVGKTDISTGCPYAMTHPVALVIERFAPQDVKERFLPELLRTDGYTPIGGTWATERHSGSDVGATETKAIKQQDGSTRLEGLKWFTSAIGFDRFITVATARPEEETDRNGKGLGLYLVPSHVDEDWSIPNDYNVKHLKDKLGTKALPTGETELTGTLVHEIVPPPHGLKAMMFALGCSRVHNAMGAAGVMHRALLEALCWTSNRSTFGDALVNRPMIQKRLLDINTEWHAGSALAFEAARSFAEVNANNGAGSETWMRIVTALAKYKTAEQAVWCAEKALEIVGGNGYTEEYPTARQLRDAMVLRVWEGPEQIQALELVRMIAGKSPGDREFINQLTAIADDLPATMQDEQAKLAALVSSLDGQLQTLRQDPSKAELVADEFLHRMADILAYALLCKEAAWELDNLENRQKQLVAGHYYDRAFVTKTGPSFEKTEIHKHFNDVIQGMPVPPSKPGQPGNDNIAP